MEIRKLREADPRIETGVTQFGNDWPGVFMRGDDAFLLAAKLRNIVHDHGIDLLNEEGLRDMIELLESSNINKR